MSLLVESINIHHGTIKNLALHELRANHSRMALFDIQTPIDLKNHIKSAQSTCTQIKCRVLYDQYIRDIQYIPYQQKKIETIRIVHADDIIYEFKYAERKYLTALYDTKGDQDEIIIIKNGYVTDGYFYNIVLEKNDIFYTPHSPLLKGVQREALLLKNKIKTKDIKVDDITYYDHIYLINAMTPLGKIKLSTKNIYG